MSSKQLKTVKETGIPKILPTRPFARCPRRPLASSAKRDLERATLVCCPLGQLIPIAWTHPPNAGQHDLLRVAFDRISVAGGKRLEPFLPRP